jgi:hypothetical protein
MAFKSWARKQLALTNKTTKNSCPHKHLPACEFARGFCIGDTRDLDSPVTFMTWPTTVPVPLVVLLLGK